MTERSYFIDQTHWELEKCNWDDELEALKTLISSFEARLDKFGAICSDAEVWLDNSSRSEEIRGDNAKFVSLLRDTILSGRARFCSIKAQIHQHENDRLEREEEERYQAEEEKQRRAQKAEEAKIADTLTCAESHKFEIMTRAKILSKKCFVDFETLSDYEILDLKKREEAFHVELRELIDKVSAFEKLIMPCGQLAQDMRDEVIGVRNRVTMSLDKFIESLKETVKSRDISEQKLKNAAALKIDIKKRTVQGL